MIGTRNLVIAIACIGTLAASGLVVGLGVDPPQTADAKALNVAGTPDSPAPRTFNTPSSFAEDPEGDARDLSVAYFNTGSQCRFGCGYPSMVAEQLSDGAPGTVPVAWMDIVEGGFLSESEDGLQLVLRVQTLTPGFPELTPAPAVARGVDYILCFGSDLGERCATLNVVPQAGGPMITSYFSIFSPFCGEDLFNDARSERPTIAPIQQASECAFEVPAAVTYGSPASIVFDVPKTFAELDGPTDGWTHIRANVTHFWLHPAPMTHGSASINLEALPHHHDHLGPVYPSGVADELPPTPTHIRFNPAVGPLPTVEGPVANAPRGLFYGDHVPKDPVHDLLGTSIREDGTDVVVTYTLAGLDRATVPDFEHISFGRVSNGPFFEFGAFHQGNDWHGYAGKCIHFHCAESMLVKLPMEVTPGAPASLELRVPREYFGNPTPGALLTFLYTITQEMHPSYYAENGHENVHTMSPVDQHVGTLPYVFVGEAVHEETMSHTHG